MEPPTGGEDVKKKARVIWAVECEDSNGNKYFESDLSTTFKYAKQMRTWYGGRIVKFTEVRRSKT